MQLELTHEFIAERESLLIVQMEELLGNVAARLASERLASGK